MFKFKRLLLFMALIPISLYAGAFLLRLFVHSGGVGLWLGIALAPGIYFGGIYARGLGDSWFYPIVITTQALYCAFLVTLFVAMRERHNEPK